MKINNRVIYYDIINIIAIIAVIAMHCNGIVHGNPYTRAWNTSLVVDVYAILLYHYFACCQVLH